MANNRAKNIAVLMAVIMLAGGGSLMLSAQSTTESDSSKSQNSTLFSRDPNAPSQKASGPVSRELFLKMTFSVLLVVSLGIVAVYLSKKFIPKLTNMPGKEIRVLEIDENAQVQDDREPYAQDTSLRPFFHPAAGAVIDHRDAEKDQGVLGDRAHIEDVAHPQEPPQPESMRKKPETGNGSRKKPSVAWRSVSLSCCSQSTACSHCH